MPKAEKSPAERLAARLNALVVAAFSLWSVPMLVFWMQAILPAEPFADAAPQHAALPWFFGSILAGAAVSRLPRSYYALRAFERGGSVYARLGVAGFRRFMTNGDIINRAVRRRFPGYCLNPANGRLAHAMKNTVDAEKAHLVMLVLGLGAAGYATANAWWTWAAWLIGSNVIANLWPVFLQRYTRGRIARISRRG